MSSLPICRSETVRPAGAGGRGEGGVALILAVFAVFLLSVAVLQTRAGVDLAEEVAVSTSREMQARYLARSGLAMVRAALGEDDTQVDSYSDDWAAANDLGAIPIADVGWAVGKVSDEEGKFNVLDLVNEDGTTDEKSDLAADRLMALLQILGLPEARAGEIVDSLIDWMDFDDAVTGSGAEDPYYGSLPNAYSCPNEPPRGMDDLALVKGIGRALLYEGEGDVPPLTDYITVYGGQRDPTSKARKVNLNTAPVEVLMSLGPGTELDNRQVAEEIVAYRDTNPFQNVPELKEVPGFPEGIYSADLGAGVTLPTLIDVASSHFSARIVGETTSASSRAYGVFRRQGAAVKLVYYRGF